MIAVPGHSFVEQILLGNPSEDAEKLSNIPEDVLMGLYPEVHQLGPAGVSPRFKHYCDLFLHGNSHVSTLGLGDILPFYKVNGKYLDGVLKQWMDSYNKGLSERISQYMRQYNKSFNTQPESENRKYVCGFVVYALNALILAEDTENNEEVLLAAEMALDVWDKQLRSKGFAV